MTTAELFDTGVNASCAHLHGRQKPEPVGCYFSFCPARKGAILNFPQVACNAIFVFNIGSIGCDQPDDIIGVIFPKT